MTFDWNYMFGLLADAEFWRATWTVIKLSTLTWFLSIVLGFLLALAKQSRLPLLSVPARGYIWLFRTQGGLGPGAEPVPTPRRPDPQPGGSGQGLCGP